MPQIEVTFDIDANGILAVAAKDKATSKEQSIRIEGSGGLAQQEIDRMVREAEAHAAEDSAKREAVEKHNALDSLIYQAEKMLADNAGKLSDADTQRVKSALEDAKKDLESEDAAKLEEARKRVEQELHKVAEVLYRSQGAQGPAAGGGGNGSPGASQGNTSDDGEVVDAEYTEEKG